MVALAVITAGCGNPAPGGVASLDTSPTTSVTSTTETAAVVDAGDLVDPEIRTVTVDGQDYLVAFAGDPATRSQGLMGVEDLGDLAGMLFDLGVERQATFTMRNTLIPLDIVFFAADGAGRAMLRMVPCVAEPCPAYPSGAAVRYALEVPADTGNLTADSVLSVP
jgi:uncharacterized membrane protein (UPF0127 family)